MTSDMKLSEVKNVVASAAGKVLIDQIKNFLFDGSNKKLKSLAESFTSSNEGNAEVISEMLESAREAFGDSSMDEKGLRPREFLSKIGIKQNILEPESIFNAVQLLWGYATESGDVCDTWAGMKKNPRARIILAIICMVGNIFKTQDLSAKEQRIEVLSGFIDCVFAEPSLIDDSSILSTLFGKKLKSDTLFGRLNNLKDALESGKKEIISKRERLGVRAELETIALESQTIRTVMHQALGEFYKDGKDSKIATATAMQKDIEASDTFISTLMDAVGVKILSEDEKRREHNIDSVCQKTEEMMKIMVAWGSAHLPIGVKLDSKTKLPTTPIVFDSDPRKKKASFLLALHKLASRKSDDKPNVPRIELTNPRSSAGKVSLVTFSDKPNKFDEIGLQDSGIKRIYLEPEVEAGEDNPKRIIAHRQDLLLYEIEKARLIYAIGRLANLSKSTEQFYERHGSDISALVLSKLFNSFSIHVTALEKAYSKLRALGDRLQASSKEVAAEISRNVSLIKNLGKSIEKIKKAIKEAIDHNDRVIDKMASGEASLEASLQGVLHSLNDCSMLFSSSGLLSQEEYRDLNHQHELIAEQIPAVRRLDVGRQEMARSVRQSGHLTEEAIIRGGELMQRDGSLHDNPHTNVLGSSLSSSSSSSSNSSPSSSSSSLSLSSGPSSSSISSYSLTHASLSRVSASPSNGNSDIPRQVLAPSSGSGNSDSSSSNNSSLSRRDLLVLGLGVLLGASLGAIFGTKVVKGSSPAAGALVGAGVVGGGISYLASKFR